MRLHPRSFLPLAALGLQSVGVVAIAGSGSTTTVVTTCSEVPVNQVINGGFESGSLSPWNKIDGVATVVDDASEASEGSYYL